jgi:hypothetical protein
MASSETLGSSCSAYVLRPSGRTGTERFPNLLCWSLSAVPPSVPRWSARVPMTVASLSPSGLRLIRRGSASTLPSVIGSKGSCNEAAKFALCYGPVDLLARLRPALLQSSFHPRSHLHETSIMTTWANSQSPTTGFAPDRPAALWAACE